MASWSDVFRQAPQKDQGRLLSLSQWLSVHHGRHQTVRVTVGWETLPRVLPPLGWDLQGHAVVPSSTSSDGLSGNQGPCSALPSPACCRCLLLFPLALGCSDAQVARVTSWPRARGTVSVAGFGADTLSGRAAQGRVRTQALAQQEVSWERWWPWRGLSSSLVSFACPPSPSCSGNKSRCMCTCKNKQGFWEPTHPGPIGFPL